MSARDDTLGFGTSMRPIARGRSWRVRGPERAAQQGFGLALFLVVLVLGTVAALLSSLNTAALRLERDKATERALAQARTALIGYAARDANRPGSLPCPDPKAVPDGRPTIADGDLDPLNNPPYNCTNTSSTRIGRLPWRTLGVPELRDGDGELLWYVVSPRFRANSTAALNSDLAGDIEVRSPANQVTASDLVALIISPGRATSGQTRPSIDPNQYLEFQDPAPAPVGGVYSYRRSVAFNDSVLPITHRDLFAAVDQAVFSRMSKTLVPKMQALANKWGRYPFAAAFDPIAFPAQGAPGTYEGSLPWANASATGARWENPVAIQIGGAGALNSQVCTVGPPGGPADPQLPSDKWMKCVIDHTGSVTFRISVTARRAARGFHDIAWDASPTFDLAAADWQGDQWGIASPTSATVRFTGTTSNTSGVLVVRLNIELAYWANPSHPWISVPPNPCTPPADGMSRAWARDCDAVWFVANEWQRQVYYAIAPAYAFGGGGWCGVCLTINAATPSTNTRAIAILAGRALDGTARPSATLANYLEGQNQSIGDNLFETGTRTFTRNDKIAILAP